MTNGSILGPKEEGDEVDLVCEAGSGKPIPRVSWYNGSTLISRAKNEPAKGIIGFYFRLQLRLAVNFLIGLAQVFEAGKLADAAQRKFLTPNFCQRL
ncbi:unnamed protein product [Ceutorhynchus assimilis]|uniref:Ig-like domain-containing protein n=1 Tax=Ceutorhynchus assimilis TaxID=467358 RepID=A0A9N9QFE1_9CUCU|nr:unnamed protein product [Ceutorhynchus assimilis]